MVAAAGLDRVGDEQVRLVVDGDENALDDSAVGDVERVAVGDQVERRRSHVCGTSSTRAAARGGFSCKRRPCQGA